MRMLMHVKFPTDDFNDALDEGDAARKLDRILEHTSPESIYFTESEGQRAAILVVEVEDGSKIPALAEPWFLSFNADVEFRIAMTLEELRRAKLDQLAEKWGDD